MSVMKYLLSNKIVTCCVPNYYCPRHRSGYSIVCAILTADCLPLLLCSKDGSELAAIHLGWRGLCQNIVDVALSRFDTDHANILAWIGPHIHSNNYEVGEQVRCTCLQAFPAAEDAFISNKAGYWLASLETLVRHDLASKGISMIYSCNECTFDDENRFFSYRRENPTGRMASLIWKET